VSQWEAEQTPSRKKEGDILSCLHRHLAKKKKVAMKDPVGDQQFVRRGHTLRELNNRLLAAASSFPTASCKKKSYYEE